MRFKRATDCRAVRPFSRIMNYLSVKIYQFVNCFVIKKYGQSDLKHQPIFIVGAPRTGSTALYQALTNSADILYIDNFSARFYRSLFLGLWLSQKLFRNRPHNRFDSLHGVTEQSGMRGPNECGQFWYRWLPRDKHFIDFDEIDKISLKSIRDEITSVINYFDRPIVFKNLNIGQRLRLIREIFPGAKIIFITRSHFHTAQSILCAKRKLGIKDDEYWSIMPKNILELRELDWPDQITKQVYFLENQIKEDMKLFNSEQCFTIHYENLGTSNISELIGGLDLKTRKNCIDPKIRNSNKISLDNTDLELLNHYCVNLWGRANNE